MRTQCPNCGTYWTYVGGGRGCLLRIYGTFGRILTALGCLLVFTSCDAVVELGGRAPGGLLWWLAGALLLIVIGRTPYWLGYAGSRHQLYCSNCAYSWREAS